VVGWHYFWCRALDAAITKAIGAILLFTCVSAFLSLVFGSLEVSGKAFRAGGYAGDWFARQLGDYLNRTGSLIVIVTLIFLAIILSTHFSLGRFFGGILSGMTGLFLRAVASFREWRDERRREKQRREVIAKHTKKGAPPEIKKPVTAVIGDPAPAQAAATATGKEKTARRAGQKGRDI